MFPLVHALEPRRSTTATPNNGSEAISAVTAMKEGLRVVQLS